MQLLLVALSPSTDASYAPSLSAYLLFTSSHGTTFPPSADMVLAFATFLFHVQRFHHRKVKRYVTALRSFCAECAADLRPFECPRLHRLYRGMARWLPGSQGQPAPRPRRLPITGPLLARILGTLSSSTARERALAAGVSIGFFGLLRAGEFAWKGWDARGNKYIILLRRHVTWGERDVSILLLESKTDHTRQGVRVRIFFCGGPFCAFTLLRAAWQRAPRQGPDDPLLQVDSRGTPLSYRGLLDFIKKSVVSFGYPSSVFGTHSLRIGGASQLAMMGFTEAQIKAAGRWLSDCYLQYVRLGDDFFQSLASALGRSAVATARPFGILPPLLASTASSDSVVALFQPRRG